MRRIIHREGVRIIAKTGALTGILTGIAGLSGCAYGLPWSTVVQRVVLGVGFLSILFLCRFFRVPDRPSDMIEQIGPDAVLSPADGTVVAIEEVFEDEILAQRRIQISVFMSIWNVHINWFPVGGFVEYFRHHQGRFLVAWHPKSSTDNERTTIVVRTDQGERIMFRQIAGFIARRIVNRSKERDLVRRGEECGFIKFGSRVDIFLPLGSQIHVGLNEKVVGTRTRIATLPGLSES